MFHVVANIDSRFSSLMAALAVYNYDTPVRPEKIFSAMPGEDAETPRICVAPTIEQCITGIGLLGRFRRCLEANEEAKSYATMGREVYPILVLQFADDLPYYTPTSEQVPDSIVTGEQWLLEPAVPTSIRLAWMGMDSILWAEDERALHGYVCATAKLDYRPFPPDKDHPWLNGRGHVLDSSEEEDLPPGVAG